MNLKIMSNKGVEIHQDMIGLFFEDINYAADGGLYAEYIENRSFEFQDARGDKNKYYQIYDGGYGWSAYPEQAEGACMEYLTEKPLNQVNPHYLHFTAALEQKGFSNKAYDGIVLKKGNHYKVSFYARKVAFNGSVNISILKDGEKCALETVKLDSDVDEWRKYEVILRADKDVCQGKFVIELSDTGIVDFDFISMMPEEAVQGVFRKDLIELLENLKPGFLRFPGGCIIEGNDLNNRYQWKKSIGDVTLRKANWNRWAVHGNSEENNYTGQFKYYNQSLGLGYYEYFLLCEQIGAKPLPVVNVGLACQYQSEELVPINDIEFEAYIQDALDLIEFANGAVDTKWGAIRAQMGHVDPFNLTMLGIGNEQWQTERVDFFQRYALFEKAIHDRYPNMKLIGSAGPDVTSEKYKAAWDYHYKMAQEKKNFAYAVDEHYYVKPEWFYQHIDFYDSYPRQVKVFSGEYAAHPEGIKDVTKRNNWMGALSEAAFLTGVERNADVVILASYAPLFARIGYTQWSPDMIWFDDEKAYATPSYYVQQMYSRNMGNYTLKSELKTDERIYQTVSYDQNSKEMIIKLVNAEDEDQTLDFDFADDIKLSNSARIITLHAEHMESCNSIECPENILPVEKEMLFEKDNAYVIKKNTFEVLRIKSTLVD